MNPLNPKKLLLTKWTVLKPVAKQKHFLVKRVIQPEWPTDPIEWVELEAVFSKATRASILAPKRGAVFLTSIVAKIVIESKNIDLKWPSY
jgi:hypothetical protein